MYWGFKGVVEEAKMYTHVCVCVCVCVRAHVCVRIEGRMHGSVRPALTRFWELAEGLRVRLDCNIRGHIRLYVAIFWCAYVCVRVSVCANRWVSAWFG